MKFILRIVVILAVLMLWQRSGAQVAYDVYIEQRTSGNRPGSVRLSPSVNSFLGFGADKRVKIFTFGSGLSVDENGVVTASGGGGGGGGGDVAGPASSTDGDSVEFSGTTGKILKVATKTGTGAHVRAVSPTFTGTPAAPTAVADTNTTQIATTAFVIGQAYLKASTAASTYQPLNSNLTSFATVTPAANVLSLLGAANYAGMRSQLNLTIGTDVQAFDADLAALAALSGTGVIYYRSAANTWTAVTIGSGLLFSSGTLSATGGGGGGIATTDIDTSAELAAIVTDDTGYSTGAKLVFNINPEILYPAAAQAADAVDITKQNGTKSYSGNFAWTLSATPPDGQKFGVHLTNSHTAAIVGTLTSWGTVYSTVRQANITSLAAVPPGEWPLLFEKVGSVIRLYNEPVANADLLATKASPALTDYLFLSDQAASGADKKSLISAILSLYDSVTATLTNKTLTAPVLGGTVTGVYTLGGTPTFPSAVVQKSTNLISFPLTIDAIADGVDYTIVRVPAAFTITQIIGVHEGSGLSSPSVVATFKHGTNRTSATTIEAVTVTSSTTGTVVTSSIDDATVPADSFIWVTLSSKSGTTANLFLQIVGTYD